MEPTLDEALLAAYLDGELTPQERQALEQRLAVEPELRQRLTVLEETWHCLDLLDRESADSDKVEATLKTVAVSLSPIPLTPLRMNRWGRWGLATAVGLAIFAVTFQLGKSLPEKDASTYSAGIEERRQLSETLKNLSTWDKESLLNEEPSLIIHELKQLWNAH